MAETFKSILLPFFLTLILKVDVQSYSHLTWVLTTLRGASKQTIMLPRELQSRSALKPSETGMGAAAVGWRVLCNPPDDQGKGGQGCLLCRVCVLHIVLHPLCMLSLSVCQVRLYVSRVLDHGNLVDGDIGITSLFAFKTWICLPSLVAFLSSHGPASGFDWETPAGL